jgi:FixJ family two-component response regulator/signal transduction histidine kinase
MPLRTTRKTAPQRRDLAAFERLLADLSARFVNLPAAQVDDAIHASLRELARAVGADRAQVLGFGPAGDDLVVTHAGALDGIRVAPRRRIHSEFPWGFARLRAGLPVVVARLADLPAAAAVDKASWQRIAVRSNLTVPLVVRGQVEGALAFGCLRRQRNWPPALVERVGVLATVFGNALAHKRAQEGLDAAIRFERVMSEILGGLLMAKPAEQGAIIEQGLASMAALFGADRATLWRRVEGGTEFARTHRWVGAGAAPLGDATGTARIPWISARLAAGVPVRFARHADLPAEAASDLLALHALGIRAALMVPLSVAGQVVGALSFATANEDRNWPEPLLPRVALFGEVLAAVFARQAAEQREREAQAQAAHATRVGTMGVFAASLVHELTQPLAASLANAETAAGLLAAPHPDLDELRATVEDIVADDRRVGELIQQLRRYLRRGESERDEVDLNEVVGETLRIVAGAAAERGVALASELADPLPRPIGDRIQLQQVLVNLLANAIEATATAGSGDRRVTLVARSTGDGVAIEVADTGPGMDEATLARVFQPFFTTKPGGMGLGLAISRSIVAAHGGTLSVRSVPEEGATFRVELPLRTAPEPRRVAPAAVITRSQGTVHVVDDDPSMRRALERQLASAGYRVECFESAQDYLARAAAADDGCIVSDVRMPGLSGLDLQATLAGAGRDLPMVFVSGHGDIPTSVSAMKSGAVGFLAKPFTREQLLAAVGEALARSGDLAAERKARALLQARYRSLTPREREVLPLVAAGLLNKIAADRLGIAEKTIKIHRGRLMEKMGAASVADLALMAERLGLRAGASTALGQ